MLHTILHFAFLTSSAFTFVCVAVLALLLVIVATNKKPSEGWVWEVPATVAALGAFWGVVAAVLHHTL